VQVFRVRADASAKVLHTSGRVYIIWAEKTPVNLFRFSVQG